MVQPRIVAARLLAEEHARARKGKEGRVALEPYEWAMGERREDINKDEEGHIKAVWEGSWECLQCKQRTQGLMG